MIKGYLWAILITFNHICLMNNPSETHERELLARLADGDERAFCELYATYKEKVSFFAIRFLKSSEVADDIVQDVFANIWQGRRFINPEQPFTAYLYTSVRNRVFNQLRQWQQQDTLREQIMVNAMDYSNDTSNGILFDDLKDMVEKAFSHLTPRQQEVFRMSRGGGMSNRMIAEQLGISVDTVQEHISVSLHTIRAYLVKYSGVHAELLLLLFL